jgi:hypothetical protein
MIRDIAESALVLAAFPFRLAGEVIAWVFGFALARDVADGAPTPADESAGRMNRQAIAELRQEMIALATAVEALGAAVFPPPPKSEEELLAEDIARETGKDCETCLSIIRAVRAKENAT